MFDESNEIHPISKVLQYSDVNSSPPNNKKKEISILQFMINMYNEKSIGMNAYHIVIYIYGFLRFTQMVILEKTCKAFHSIAQDPHCYIGMEFKLPHYIPKYGLNILPSATDYDNEDAILRMPIWRFKFIQKVIYHYYIDCHDFMEKYHQFFRLVG